MATISPQLILASYSCARRDHIVRLTRARPFSVSSARLTRAGSESLRMPTLATLAVGTRKVILSFMKLITKSSSLAPAISSSSTRGGIAGFATGLAATTGLAAVFTVLATFEAGDFEPVAFATVLVVLW